MSLDDSKDNDDNGHKEQENEPVTHVMVALSCERVSSQRQVPPNCTGDKKEKRSRLSYLSLQRNLLVNEASYRISYWEMHPLRLHRTHATERGLLPHPRR